MPLFSTRGAASGKAFGLTSGAKPISLQYLVVAGGGTGQGPDRGMGGGGGGMRTNFTGDPLAGAPLFVKKGTYSVTIGGAQTNSNLQYGNGDINATAGGSGSPGGSGSGGFSANDPGSRLGKTGNLGGYSPAEGNPGGDAQPSSGNPYAAGGGGGAGATGGAYNTGGTNGGPGGNGSTSEITGSSVTYAGGGGGGVYQSGSGGNGGSGGGAGSRGSGSPNTGGGGGGANMITREDRFGGSGIVVIRVPSTVPLTSSGGTPSTAPNGDKIVTFNGSGTYTVG
jgi:hypothetical protein